jgi:hypothetical protein
VYWGERRIKNSEESGFSSMVIFFSCQHISTRVINFFADLMTLQLYNCAALA